MNWNNFMFNYTLASAFYKEKDPWNIFKDVKSITNVEELEKNQILVLWGGEDIGTKLYKEHPITPGEPYEPTNRDVFELALINKAIKLQIPIIGICRGAQLLCVHQGGKLIQHVPGHNQAHRLYLPNEDKLIPTNSWHHQVMQPTNDAEILAISSQKTNSGYTKNKQYIVFDTLPEIVKWPKIKALGIQGHPEFFDAPQELINYTRNLILNLK